jgi:serine/threonine protein kinase
MFAKVLLVQTRNSSKLALKVVRRSIRPHGCALDSELCMLKHPFIVPMHLVFATDTKCYTLMEYIDGTSLAAHLVQSHIFSEEQARVILAELLSALVEVHAHKIVHRNVRPASILLDRHGHAHDPTRREVQQRVQVHGAPFATAAFSRHVPLGVDARGQFARASPLGL